MPDPIASSPDGYEIHRELGRGATAVVYLAHDKKHDRFVALKVLKPNLMLTPARFLAEIRTIAGLQHPHILPLHDSGAWNDSPFFVMPYVAGETLEERLEREGTLPLTVVARIAKDVGDALEYAHRRGIVHRDIKPANILLADGNAYVADFGIAHVITLAAPERATGAAFVVGTPAYMSPEQASGEREADARSDLYSLGCVMYEMITGEPPFAGAGPRVNIAQRISNPPPGVRALRPEVPASLGRIVDTLLAPRPEDRYQTAAEFVAAVAETERTTADFAPRRTRRQLTVAALAVVGVTAAGWYGVRAAKHDDTLLDRSTYAVFPFRHVGKAENVWLDGDGCARLLHDAMARWQGVRLVDDMRVSDIWTRAQPRTVPDVFSAARALHAGNVAWGEVLGVGDSLEIRAVLYDMVRGPDATRSFSVRLARDAPQLERAFTTLADSILVGGQRSREGAATGTRNLQALEHFLAGREAVDRFDLHQAEEEFRAAVATDELYAHAHFWLARTMAWNGESEPSAWAGNASRAATLTGSLSSRDRAHAAALLELAQGGMVDACRRYRALIDSDSLDFAAWFGLGDCNARDPLVVRDPRSPSGYTFRGGYHTAVAAYRRALMLVPSFHTAEQGLAFQRLSRRVLFTEEARLRRGYALLPDTQRFGARPSFAADTLAFVPVPWLTALSGTVVSPTERQAVAWSTETYRQLMAEWVRAFPASGDALESNALALEASSRSVGSGVAMSSALASARRAVRASQNADERVRRTAMVVRLLLKMDSTSAARALSDSALGASRAPSPYQAGYLAGLAALTGRATRAAALLGHAASDGEHIPYSLENGKRPAVSSDVMSGALQLETYAALGGPRDSVRAVFGRTWRLIDTWVPTAERANVRQALFRNAYGMAYDQLAPVSSWVAVPHADLVVAMHLAMTKKDSAETRRARERFIAATARYSPGTMGIDRLYQYSRMLLTLGDTAAAIEQLDVALGALPRARGMLLKVVTQAGTIVPAMLLRAELALRRGDTATFNRWARPAVLLWSDADPELKRPVDQLRSRMTSPP